MAELRPTSTQAAGRAVAPPASAKAAVLCLLLALVPGTAAARGYTMGEVYGISAAWADDFLKHPDQEIEKYIGIPACSSDPSCIEQANSILNKRKAEWKRSPEKCKVLFCLSYIIGSEILKEKKEYKLKLETKDGFLADLTLESESKAGYLFSDVANFDKPWFVLDEDGFDLLFWKQHLIFSSRPAPGSKAQPGQAQINILLQDRTKPSPK